MSSRTPLATLIALAAAASLHAAPPTGGNDGGNSNSSGSQSSSDLSRPRVTVATPGYANPRDAVGADVLLSSVQFADGVTVGPAHFVHVGNVMSLSFGNNTGSLRVANGPLATIGSPGVSFIEAQDLDNSSISSFDRIQFCQKIDQSLQNANLNNRVGIKGANGLGFTCTMALESLVFDSHPGPDNRPEIFIFEEQGNSVLTVQALNDLLLPVGTPIEVRAVDLASVQPAKIWVGRIADDGALLSGAHELKMFAIDLTTLGVPNLRYLRITNSVSSGGNSAADLKVIGVDTSPQFAPETMGFD
ncbi:MAG: hypothetical protein ACKOYN_03030 [Planctomycetota bacterium]